MSLFHCPKKPKIDLPQRFLSGKTKCNSVEQESQSIVFTLMVNQRPALDEMDIQEKEMLVKKK